MNWKDNINDLQEKFWTGETSLEEEKILASHYKESDEDEVLGHYFQYLEKERAVTCQPKRKTKTVRMRNRTVYSIAASFAILVAAVVLLKPNTNDSNVYVAQTPEEALEITQNTLAFISGKVNRSNNLIFNNLNEYNKINFFK